MSEKELSINFSLVHIEENQFSTFEEMLDAKKPIQQEIGFGFGADVEARTIAVSMEFVLYKEEKPLLKLKITNVFEVESNSFEQKILQEKKIVLPCEFGKHLAVVTTGTARGVLFANTKNTPFNKYLMGLINVDEMFYEDISLEI